MISTGLPITACRSVQSFYQCFCQAGGQSRLLLIRRATSDRLDKNANSEPAQIFKDLMSFRPQLEGFFLYMTDSL